MYFHIWYLTQVVISYRESLMSGLHITHHPHGFVIQRMLLELTFHYIYILHELTSNKNDLIQVII